MDFNTFNTNAPFVQFNNHTPTVNSCSNCTSCNNNHQQQLQHQDQPQMYSQPVSSSSSYMPSFDYNHVQHVAQPHAQNHHPHSIGYNQQNMDMHITGNISSSSSSNSSFMSSTYSAPDTYTAYNQPPHIQLQSTTTKAEYYSEPNNVNNQVQNFNVGSFQFSDSTSFNINQFQMNQQQPSNNILPFPSINELPQININSFSDSSGSIAPIFPAMSPIPNNKRSISEMTGHQNNNNEQPPLKKRRKRSTLNVKMSTAVEQLKEFSKNHGGKLPSLRYVMRMLKVGFPKAHEIIDCYAEEIGQSKDDVVQSMTVRQESEKKSNGKISTKYVGRKKKKVQIDDNKEKNGKNEKKIAQKEAEKKAEENEKEVPSNRNENDESTKRILSKLEQYLFILSSKEVNLSTNYCERSYIGKINEIESFLNEDSVQNMILQWTVQNKFEIVAKFGSAYWILCHFYYSRDWQREIGYKYMQKSLVLFKHCCNECNHNKEAKKSEYDQCLARVLLQGGDYKMDEKAYDDAIVFYLQCYKLSDQQSKADANFVTNVLMKSMQRMIICHNYKKEYVEAIKFGHILLAKMIKWHECDGCVSISNLIEFKAYFSWLLWCSNESKDQNDGHKYYQETMREIKTNFGVNDARYHEWSCYFIRGLIDTEQWNQAHQAMDKLVAINGGNVSDENKEEMHRVFELYVNGLNDYIESCAFEQKQSFLRRHRQKIVSTMTILHNRHTHYVHEINIKAKIKQCQSLNYNNEYKQTNESEKTPKIQICQILIGHIKLLQNLGDNVGANEILNHLVYRYNDKKCLNVSSPYLEHYDVAKMDKKAVEWLLNL